MAKITHGTIAVHEEHAEELMGAETDRDRLTVREWMDFQEVPGLRKR